MAFSNGQQMGQVCRLFLDVDVLVICSFLSAYNFPSNFWFVFVFFFVDWLITRMAPTM